MNIQYQLFKAFLLSLFLFHVTSSNAMLKALNTAATGMAAMETNVNTISQNIANLNTIGFKKSRTEFEDLLYETQVVAGSRSSNNSRYNVGIQIGSGAKVSAIRKEFTQGAPVITNRPFDLMVNGEGFFGVILPNGTIQYTRDGAFNVNAQGQFVSKNGYKIFPSITLPPGTLSVNISETGNVEAYMKGQLEPTAVGVVPVFTFINPVGLRAQGGNLYSVTKSSGQAIQNIPGENNAGSIMQGSLESSNVSVMNEMTGLIKAQRAYEMNAKVMGIADQMLQTINTIR
jgi:flagellar basal-body rod protein FlgG